MDINKHEESGKNIVRADKSSAPFAEKKKPAFSINKFLKGLGDSRKIDLAMGDGLETLSSEDIKKAQKKTTGINLTDVREPAKPFNDFGDVSNSQNPTDAGENIASILDDFFGEEQDSNFGNEQYKGYSIDNNATELPKNYDDAIIEEKSNDISGGFEDAESKSSLETKEQETTSVRFDETKSSGSGNNQQQNARSVEIDESENNGSVHRQELDAGSAGVDGIESNGSRNNQEENSESVQFDRVESNASDNSQELVAESDGIEKSEGVGNDEDEEWGDDSVDFNDSENNVSNEEENLVDGSVDDNESENDINAEDEELGDDNVDFNDGESGGNEEDEDLSDDSVDVEEDEDIEEDEVPYAIRLFAGKVWTRKPVYGSEELETGDGEDYLPDDLPETEAQTDDFDLLLSDYQTQDEGQSDEAQDETTFEVSETEQEDAEKNKPADDGLNLDSIDEFSAFLKSLEDNQDTTVIAQDKETNKPQQSEQAIEKAGDVQSEQTEQTSKEQEEQKDNAHKKSISKLDYFKYRFLSNSAVGAEGKAKVEELATKFGTGGRKDNAGIITSEQSGDVTVHYNGEFKQDDIDLDFSKKGNAKVYKNSKVLSMVSSVLAVVYAIIGITMFLVFGKVIPEPVVVQAVSLNIAETATIYQEVGTELDLSGIKVITTYSNGETKETQVTRDMMVSMPANLDDNFIVRVASNMSCKIEILHNGKIMKFNLYAYKWEASDIKVYYHQFSAGAISNENTLCYALFEKILENGYTISLKRNIDLFNNNNMNAIIVDGFGNFVASEI